MAPLVTLPQVITIWISHDVSGVSALTWGSYAVVAAFWLVYGFLHKEKPIIIVNAALIILQISIVVGIFLYG